jgi:transcriptional regulator with XRE-family HTH domain
MDIKSIFGKNLKFYRKTMKLSQEELAEKVEISVKHLSSIERGLTFVSADLLEKLSVFVEVPIFYFFVDENKNFSNEAMLNTIGKIIEKHLLDTIEVIKSDIRKKNN